MNIPQVFISDILWRPQLPVAVIGLLFAIGVVAALFAYLRTTRIARWRRAGLTMLRLAAVALLAFIMLGPSRMAESPRAQRRGRLFILADVSESMLTQNSDGQTRLQAMQQKWLSESAIQKLQTVAHVQPYQFAEKPQPLSISARPVSAIPDEETHLVQSCTRLMSQIRPQKGDALLLLSDGIDSADASVSRIGVAAKASQLEVHTVAFGENSSNPDAALIATAMQKFLYPNESGTILVRIYQVGCRGKKSVLTVKQGKNTQTFPVDFTKRDYAEVKIPVNHKEQGQYGYQCDLAAIPGEKETGNNTQTVFVGVEPRRMEVLLLEGSPNWDSKFIAQSLRKDTRIALTQISQITETKTVTIMTRSAEKQPSFRMPETAEQWAEFDVVLLGRNIENVLSEESAKALVQHHEQAGISIVFARGRACDPDTIAGRTIGDVLKKIEPVTWGNQRINPGRMNLTPSGKVMQWFSPTNIGLDVESALSRLNGFQVADEIKTVSPVARVVVQSRLTENSQQVVPSIITRSGEASSVVTFAGDGLWKWSLLPPEAQDLAGFFDSFWSNLIRWLVVGSDFQPGADVSMRLSHSNVRIGEEVVFDIALKRALSSESEPTLSVELPDGSTAAVPLTPVTGRTPRLRGKLKVDQPGVHEATLLSLGLNPENLSQKFSIYNATTERLNTAAQPVNLKMIAEQSNGQFYGPNDCEKFLDQLKSDKEADKLPPRTEYIWDRGWLLFLVALIAGIEWIFRVRLGLI